MRTIIDLPDEQIAGLTERCQREEISRAEAVRRAVALYLAAADDRRQRRLQTAGSWKKYNIDAQALIDSLRAEWDR